MTEVYIVSYTRTPLGSFNGKLSHLSVPELCGYSIKSCIEKSKILPSQIDSVFVGNVISAGIGQNPAKQCAIAGGLPSNIPCTLINKVCCSSLKAFTLGVQQIKSGDGDCILIAGVENMSKTPHLLPNSRTGTRMGDFSCIDSMVKDGLWDSFNNLHMGTLVDTLAEKFEISREEQDRYSIESFKRANEATNNKLIEITPIQIKEGLMNSDESLTKLIPSKVPLLKPCFNSKGTITAANASSISDGSVSIIICSNEFLKKNNLNPICKIISYADSGIDPSEFPLAPIEAANKALKKANLNKDQIDLW